MAEELSSAERRTASFLGTLVEGAKGLGSALVAAPTAGISLLATPVRALRSAASHGLHVVRGEEGLGEAASGYLSDLGEDLLDHTIRPIAAPFRAVDHLSKRVGAAIWDAGDAAEAQGEVAAHAVLFLAAILAGRLVMGAGAPPEVAPPRAVAARPAAVAPSNPGLAPLRAALEEARAAALEAKTPVSPKSIPTPKAPAAPKSAPAPSAARPARPGLASSDLRARTAAQIDEGLGDEAGPAKTSAAPRVNAPEAASTNTPTATASEPAPAPPRRGLAQALDENAPRGPARSLPSKAGECAKATDQILAEVKDSYRGCMPNAERPLAQSHNWAELPNKMRRDPTLRSNLIADGVTDESRLPPEGQTDFTVAEHERYLDQFKLDRHAKPGATLPKGPSRLSDLPPSARNLKSPEAARALLREKGWQGTLDNLVVTEEGNIYDRLTGVQIGSFAE